MPEGMKNCVSGVENRIFSNRLLMTEECKKNVQFMKLTAESDTTMMFTTCCKSIICGHAPKFANNSITVPTGHTTVSGAEDKPLMLTVFTSEIPEDKQTSANIPAGVPVVDGAKWDEESLGLVNQYIAAVNVEEKVDGCSFTDLVASRDILVADNLVFEN